MLPGLAIFNFEDEEEEFGSIEFRIGGRAVAEGSSWLRVRLWRF